MKRPAQEGKKNGGYIELEADLWDNKSRFIAQKGRETLFMKYKEETVESERLYQGKIISLRKDIVRLEDGRETLREVVEHPGGVGVLPLESNGDVYLVKQYRHGARKSLLEIPAGKRDPGEEPLECGKRELLEEVGASAEEFLFLGDMLPTPAYCEEVIPIFLAKKLSFSEQNLDEGEFLSVVRMPLTEVVKQVLSGEITDAKTQCAVLKAAVLEGLLSAKESQVDDK